MMIKIFFIGFLTVHFLCASQRQESLIIVGGGAAGLTSAWLLDGHFDITLLEQQGRLGGHAYSIAIGDQKKATIELGAEFFSDAMFPYFNRLLSLLQVPVYKYPLTYVFYTTDNKKAFMLPPVTQKRMSWHMFAPYNVYDLLQLNHLINKSKKIIKNRDTITTLEEWVESLSLTTSFKNDILYPLLAASWGVTIDDVKTFIAYDILVWLVRNKPAGLKPILWNEVVGGMSAYIKAMVQQLNNVRITLHTNIATISYRNHIYHIQESDGSEYRADYLIIATNAYDAAKLLRAIPHAKKLRNYLSSIEYFPATIAVHGDTRLMPRDTQAWSIINIRFDGLHGQLTTYKPWHCPEKPVFRSWITFDDNLPRPLYALKQYHHAKVNRSYFQAQEAIARLQGVHNLWLAGLYTNDVDDHESAIVSALFIAQKLAPHSERLQALLDIHKK